MEVPDDGPVVVHYWAESALMPRIAANLPLDRRAARTRQALTRSLIELLAERGWDDIGVQDVCEHADVARSTFYLHYESKEDLLQGGLDNLRAVLRANAPSAADATRGWTGFAFVPGLLEHVQENQQIFRSVVGRRSGYERFNQSAIALLAARL